MNLSDFFVNINAYVDKFMSFYMEKHEESPEDWPLDLSPQEWMSELTVFIMEEFER